MPAPDFLTVVSGLPRSGTSLLMQMLAAGGIPPLTDNLRPADESNPRGYFEFAPVRAIRNDTSWLPQARGHAVKIIHLLIRELPADGRFQYRVLLLKRPIEEVVASQRVMLERQGKESADEKTLIGIYQEQLRQTETWLSTQPCFRVAPVEYHRILQEPIAVANEIRKFLETDLNVDAMAAAVDTTLYRQRGDG